MNYQLLSLTGNICFPYFPRYKRPTSINNQIDIYSTIKIAFKTSLAAVVTLKQTFALPIMTVIIGFDRYK